MEDSEHSGNSETPEVYKFASKDGHFRRAASQFRNFVSPEAGAEFPAEKGRYVLYLNLGCPWAHRTNLVRSLKGLENVIELVVMGYVLTSEGWVYDGSPGSVSKDPLYGFTKHRQLYFKADPDYQGRFTVPVLWDKYKETIVSNESSEIIRMFYSSFDAFVEPKLRNDVIPYIPVNLATAIEEMNEWVYDKVNNGVYKCGFASSQEAYDANVYQLFDSLDRLEQHLLNSEGPYLFGNIITDADIRLYPTIARFDTGYFTLFKCNLKSIRHDYPNLHKWLRQLYWDDSEKTNGGAFRKTTHWKPIREGYTYSLRQIIVPAGPAEPILKLDGGARPAVKELCSV